MKKLIAFIAAPFISLAASAQVADSTSAQVHEIAKILPASWAGVVLTAWTAYEVLSHLIPTDKNYSIVNKLAIGISWISAKLNIIKNRMNS